MTTIIRPPTFAPAVTGDLGAAPKTRELANYEAQVETFRPTSRKTPRGQPLTGDARRGGRLLAICSVVLSLAGIGSEIASMLAAVSGANQVKQLNWPIAEGGVWTWDKCEFLPSSDAPATSYGVGISLFFHVLNVVIFIGMISYLVRFATRPRADYGIGVSGLFMAWLGLGMASRWVGTIQLVVGVLLLIFGLLDVIFDHNLLFKAAREAYSGVKPPPVLAPAAAKSAAESNAEKARDLMRAMESYAVPDPYSGYTF